MADHLSGKFFDVPPTIHAITAKSAAENSVRAMHYLSAEPVVTARIHPAADYPAPDYSGSIDSRTSSLRY